jgi:ElaB/YqjD/DUF883 family membrane-anchored ribosome-binding protein
MSNFLSEIEAKVQTIWAKLAADFHPAAADAKALLDQVRSQADTDAEQVAEAAKPVVEEAVTDVKDVAEGAVQAVEADVKQLDEPAPATVVPAEATPATETDPAAPAS